MQAMNWLVRCWSMVASGKKTQATLLKAVSVARDLKSTIENAGTAELQDLLRRAEAGDVKAQYDLGESYYTGAGVPQDYSEAARWFRVAAERGNGQAQTTLGMMYAAGRGVPLDLVEALRWFESAGAKKNQTAIRLRDKLLARLSPEEIAEATRRSQMQTSSAQAPV
jgi:TPR repeat protein